MKKWNLGKPTIVKLCTCEESHRSSTRVCVQDGLPSEETSGSVPLLLPAPLTPARMT